MVTVDINGHWMPTSMKNVVIGFSVTIMIARIYLINICVLSVIQGVVEKIGIEPVILLAQWRCHFEKDIDYNG